MITSHFWNYVLQTWLDLNYHDPSMPVPTLLWNNSHIKYQGTVLMFTDWIIGIIFDVKDIKGPIKAVSGHKIARNRFNTTYRSVLTFEEKKQSITHLFKKKKIRPRLGCNAFILAKRSENTVN